MTNNRFTNKELQEFCQFLAREYGLSFPPARFSFVENRVEKVLENFSLRTLSDIVLTAPRNLQLRMELLNVLTTNETWFFRHPEHFTILREHVLPEILRKKAKTSDNRIRIWSAGCSIGAELYSILFTLLNQIKNPQLYSIKLTGSDIASDAIKTAKAGIYSDHELRLLSDSMLKKFFDHSSKNKWQIKPELMNFVDFEMMNLLDSWPPRTFDIIFCRNTMIYFDGDNKKRLTRRFLDSLQPNGYFFTSANEMIHTDPKLGFTQLFIENEIIYQKGTPRKNYVQIRFKSPSDLLRAINLLKNHSFDYYLEKIEAKSNLAPSRAVLLNIKELAKVEELFSLSSIKSFSPQYNTK